MYFQGKEFTPYDLAVIKGYKDAADYLKQKGALPCSDLSNVEKRDSKSARSHNISKIAPVNEEKTGQKSPTKNKTTPTKEVGKGTSSRGENVSAAKPLPVTPVKATEKKSNEEKQPKSVSPTLKSSPTTGSPSKSKSPKLDKAVGIDKSTTGVNTDVDKKQKNESQKSSAGSVLEKGDGIRKSADSLRSAESPLTKNATTQKKGPSLRDESTSPMGQSQGKKKKDTGKYVSVERIEPVRLEDEADMVAKKKQQARGTAQTPRSRVGFKDNDDSGNETDLNRSRSRRGFKNKKPYIDHVRDSVRLYQTRRNQSRSLNQLKRAQIHTGPMHDIVMFSKMMDNYRRGVMGDEEEMDLRNYANWDGYLNGECILVFTYYAIDEYIIIYI